MVRYISTISRINYTDQILSPLAASHCIRPIAIWACLTLPPTNASSTILEFHTIKYLLSVGSRVVCVTNAMTDGKLKSETESVRGQKGSGCFCCRCISICRIAEATHDDCRYVLLRNRCAGYTNRPTGSKASSSEKAGTITVTVSLGCGDSDSTDNPGGVSPSAAERILAVCHVLSSKQYVGYMLW